MDSTTPDRHFSHLRRAHPLARVAWVAPMLALSLLAAGPAVSAATAPRVAPTASFTNSPTNPVVGELVTFTSTSTDPDGEIEDYDWDTDGDGFDDGDNPTTSRTYTTAGNKTVRLRLDYQDGSVVATRTIPVTVNAPPIASFNASTTTPDTGQTVTLTSTSSDPEGRPLSQAWDLDNNGSFNDATGGTASVSFPQNGTRQVRLRVRDHLGLEQIAVKDLAVQPPPPAGGTPPPASFPPSVVTGPPPPRPTLVGPRLLDPFPLVRIRGVTTSRGARLDLLSVRTPGGTKILVRCKGRGCPWARKTELARFGASRLRAVNMPGFKRRHLRAGTVLEVFVTRKGMIGKYTRIKIRRLKAPLRVDSCTAPGVARVRRCPA